MTHSVPRTARHRSRLRWVFCDGKPTRLGGDPGDAIAVIGDGSMSAGMAFEAMNNAGA